MTIRYPAPLKRGDRIGITSPSSGVPGSLRPRLEFCVDHLRQRGYEIAVGACMDGNGAVSAPARARADELATMLIDPDIRAVVPPWGGELAVEILPHLDMAAIAASDPTWLVGYSDLTTLLLPVTTLTGIATVHGQNLMDTPYRTRLPNRFGRGSTSSRCRPGPASAKARPRTIDRAGTTAGRMIRPSGSTPSTHPAAGASWTRAWMTSASRAG